MNNLKTLMAARSEYEEQVTVFEWAALYEHKYPELRLLFGSLMGIKLSPRLLNKARKAGMKKGKPDIHLPVARGGYYGLWIELKRTGGRKPNPDQITMLRALESQGYYATYRKGAAETIKLIESYLKGELVRNK